MPVHVIGGEHDILVPVWKSREIAERIPGSKLTILPAAPHGLSIERAEEFNAAVLELHPGGGCYPCGVAIAAERGVHVLADGRGAVELDDLEHARHRAARSARRRAAAAGGFRPAAPGANSIDTPLESMKSSPDMSTTSPRAELGTASAIVRPGRLRDRDVQLPRQPRDDDVVLAARSQPASSRSSRSTSRCPSLRLRLTVVPSSPGSTATVSISVRIRSRPLPWSSSRSERQRAVVVHGDLDLAIVAAARRPRSARRSRCRRARSRWWRPPRTRW